MYFKDQTCSLGLSLFLHPEPAIPPRYTVMHAHIHNTPAPASAPTSSEFPHAPMSPFSTSSQRRQPRGPETSLLSGYFLTGFIRAGLGSYSQGATGVKHIQIS